MLHRIMIAGALLLARGAVAAPGEGAPLRDPLTTDTREALRVELRAVTVVVRREGAQPRGMWAPGGGRVEGHGWWAAPGRVVTAASLVAEWPVGPKDVIEVETPAGARFAAAVGVAEEALGLVVLDVPGLDAPPKTPATATADVDVSPGRPLYAADGSGLLHRVVVGRAGQGQHAYYWEIDAHLSAGTPLFDGRGRLATLVGRDRDERSLALPAKALRALLAREDWR